MQITISLTAQTTKRLLVLASAGATLFAGAYVYAAVPHLFADGDVLSAAKLNANFADADAKSAALEAKVAELATKLSAPAKPVVTVGGKQFSVGGLVKQTTTKTTGNIESGALRGYTAAKDLCEKQVGTATAHMCSAEEMSRTMQAGLTTAGWYTIGLNTGNSECNGWTNPYALDPTLDRGPYWAGSQASSSKCDQLLPLLCCD